MLENLTASLIELIRSQGLFAVVLGVLIETIIIPIPSPLILMAAGAILVDSASFLGMLPMTFLIALVAAVTQTLGSFLLYLPSYYLGKPFIERFENIHGVSWKEIREFEKKFKGRGQAFAIFVLRAIPIMPISIVSALCGLIKVNVSEYALFTFLGTIPRNLMLVILGWLFKEAYDLSAARFDHLETITTIIILALIALYIIAHKSGLIWKIRKRLFSPGKTRAKRPR